MSFLRNLMDALQEIADAQQAAANQAAQQREAQQQQAQQRKAQQRKTQRRKTQQGQAQPAARPRPDQGKVLDAEVVEATPIRRRAAVPQHVAQHLDTSAITASTQQLGAEVGQADAKVETRLREKFDREVGRLGDTDQQTDPVAGSTLAAQVAGMLRNPRSVQQAFILNEIFTRPEHRW